MCPICLEEETDEKPLDGSCALCPHVFHKECLNTWLVRNNNCPLCCAPCTNEYSRRIKRARAEGEGRGREGQGGKRGREIKH